MDDAETLHHKIKKYGPQAKADADAFAHSLAEKYTKENPASDEIIKKGLEGILAKYQSKTGSPTAPGTSNNQRLVHAAAAVLIAVALASLGMPYTPPPIY